MKNIHIIGGGTVSHIRNHLALTAPAYGATAKKIYRLCCDYISRNQKYPEKGKSYLYGQPVLALTKMANSGMSKLETNEDVYNYVYKDIILDKKSSIVFFNPALVDYNGTIDDVESGKYQTRLKTSEGNQLIKLIPADKVLKNIRKDRKDIFLVAFKTTCGATEDEQFLSGLHLLKANSCNLVLANDTKTRVNMIITPEQARYSVSTDRDYVLEDLVHMAFERANGTFTRSTVIESGKPVPWNSKEVSSSLRTVVDHCIAKGAYKPFKGKTVGHFAAKVDHQTFLTSIRGADYNKLDEVGLVKVYSVGQDSVISLGAKPSVGGQSQRIIFKEHPDVDSIVHFHVPPKDSSHLSVRLQKYNECGSHQCGQNTSDGLRLEEDGIKCVYLDNHGPNIVFNSSIDPQKVINFIDKHFDLSQSTDKIDRNTLNVQ
jgi:hypothetical protein